MTHAEIFVEEPSAFEALQNLLPRILREGSTFRLHNFNGKKDMLEKLPKLLKGYRRSLREDWKIVVLLDNDDDDCQELKNQLESYAIDAGLYTKSNRSPDGRYQVINRIAIEELEAWFFGDIDAMRVAYPRVSPTLGLKEKYRDPDAITGGTAEALERLLRHTGYLHSRMRKIETARRISEGMNPEKNRSKSFQIFRAALLEL